MHAWPCATTTHGASRGREFETGDMGVARYSGQGSKRDDRTWRQFRKSWCEHCGRKLWTDAWVDVTGAQSELEGCRGQVGVGGKGTH